jgi:hypothetical protein
MTSNRASMNISGKKALCICTLILMLISGASSQDVASGLATANVTDLLSVTATQNLAFGLVFQGVAKSVGNNVTASSGIFTITGQAGANISVYFVLPEYMATATGDDRMIIAFGAADMTYDSTVNLDPATPGGGALANINPRAIPATTYVGGNNQAAIFLGGKVTPAVNQKAGAYTGDILVTVAYTGS